MMVNFYLKQLGVGACLSLALGLGMPAVAGMDENNQRIALSSDDPNLDPAIKRIFVVAADSYVYYRQKGMLGLEHASKDCYKQTQGSVECLYIDATAHLIDKKFLEALKQSRGVDAPADPYFTEEAILNRAKPSFKGSHAEQKAHWSALVNLIGQIIDDYMQQDAKRANAK